MKKRVAIIGAGVSGLAAIKCCLDEELEPVCFERSGDIGGTWNYEEGLKIPGSTCVMHSTITNISKEFLCYTDFPCPKEFPIFMHHRKMLEYLTMYAENFNLQRYVQFYMEIVTVKRSQDFSTSGRWTATWKNLKTQEEKCEVFDAVMLCTGKLTNPRTIPYEGLENFKGQILYSSDYKTHHGFEGKKVVIIGMKFTGTDIAVELSGLGCEVYSSTRRGVWITGRLVDGKLPSEIANFIRVKSWIIQSLPVSWGGKMLKNAFNQNFQHASYGVEPKHLPGIWNGLYAISDSFTERIVSGRVIVKPNVSKFTETSVEFEDGSVVNDVDVVIFATGYSTSLPYLEDGLFTFDENSHVELYRTIFSPYIRPATIALIGFEYAAGGVQPLSDMQCRIATRVFKGDIKLPTEKEMLKEIRIRREKIREIVKQLNFDGQPDFLLHDYMTLMTQLSEMCGCSPGFFKLLWMDRRLAWQYLFGPAVPAQFRLCGHGAWAGAKDTVLSTNQRSTSPYPQVIKPNDAALNNKKPNFTKCLLVFASAVAIYTLARSYFFNGPVGHLRVIAPR